MIKQSLATEKCEKLKFTTPPKDFLDIWGPEGPVVEPFCVNVEYFFSSRNQLDFGLVFEPQNGSFLSPRDPKMAQHTLSNGVPGTLFDRFGSQGSFQAHFGAPFEVRTAVGMVKREVISMSHQETLAKHT